MNGVAYDLSTARKNPYADKLKNGYTIRINVLPKDERKKEMDDFFVSDEKLQMIKAFVASEERKRKLVRG